jgi:hypothetical protein
MKTESWSTWIWAPNLRSPAESHVQRVEECVRSSGLSPSRTTNTITEQTNATSVEQEARSPAWKRLMRSPRRAISRVPAAGAKSAIQAAVIISLSKT